MTAGSRNDNATAASRGVSPRSLHKHTHPPNRATSDRVAGPLPWPKGKVAPPLVALSWLEMGWVDLTAADSPKINSQADGESRQKHSIGDFMEETAVVTQQPFAADALRPFLEACGYTDSRLAPDYQFNGSTAPLVGFFGKPWDTRTACVAAVNAEDESREMAARCIPIGAPTVFVCQPSRLDVWLLTPSGPTARRSLTPNEIGNFFETHKTELSPKAIHDAKMRLPVSRARQMEFVDIGLMPAVERKAGETLHRLVEGAIQDLTAELGQKLLRIQAPIPKLYRTVFWLLAAKILHEKQVEKFIRLNLNDVDQVFDRVAKHYGSTDNLPPGGKAWRPAIDMVAESIGDWGHLGHLSTEAIGYLYEMAMIDKKPIAEGSGKAVRAHDIRKELGIHSTPPSLVDHMLAQLWPLIEEIEPENRFVLEPACGHGSFLIAALRWLREYSGLDEGLELHQYLRAHLHGIEVEPFARELAKLSLALADVPYGNSWQIDEVDMFEPEVLRRAAERSMILLANPPYESFTSDRRKQLEGMGQPVTAKTKAVEMLNRTLPYLRHGAVFGVVVPRGTLYNLEAQPVRDVLLKQFDLSEVSIYADNLFEESKHEVAVLLGSRRRRTRSHSQCLYRRVRNSGMAAFKSRLAFSSERQVLQSRFTRESHHSLFLPDLLEVWDYLSNLPKLGNAVNVQKGFEFSSTSQLKDREVISNSRKHGWIEAALNVAGSYGIWSLPPTQWVDFDESNIRRPGAAGRLGVPQIIVNYAPIAPHEPWRLKAVVDEVGLAISSRFLAFRPRSRSLRLRVLWAILNSPLANAYAYCHSGKRETLVKEWRAFPLPPVTHQQTRNLLTLVSEYLELVQASDNLALEESDDEAIHHALLAMDAEVLRLYDLPPRLERQLLDRFDGVERRGVGCEFRGYYPNDLDVFVPLHELISDEYACSMLERFCAKHEPEDDPEILAALRHAAESFAEE